MQVTEADLRLLHRSFPLPESWAPPVLFSEPSSLGRLSYELVGVSSQHGIYGEVFGSAAGAPGSPLLERAYFELIERLAALEASFKKHPLITLYNLPRTRERKEPREKLFPKATKLTCFPVSSGAGAAADWSSACQHAALELLERDLLIRSWYRANPVPIPTKLWLGEISVDHEVDSFFLEGASPLPAEVAVVVAYPTKPDAPLSVGFGAGAEKPVALSKALAECVQRLLFLRGEPLPAQLPTLQPSAQFHQDYYLHPSSLPKLQRWLQPRSRKPRGLEPLAKLDSSQIWFADITPKNLKGRLAVAKAYHPRTIRGFFGFPPQDLLGKVDDALLIHPIA
ncbi:MAG: YcaO-like family protein [Bdellovibrionota bacterium]